MEVNVPARPMAPSSKCKNPRLLRTMKKSKESHTSLLWVFALSAKSDFCSAEISFSASSSDAMDFNLEEVMAIFLKSFVKPATRPMNQNQLAHFGAFGRVFGDVSPNNLNQATESRDKYPTYARFFNTTVLLMTLSVSLLS